MSSPEKLRSSINKVERAYQDIKSSLDESKSPSTFTTQVLCPCMSAVGSVAGACY